jgi:hypothetical protein
MAEEDKRLERQQTYHQFHLGVYISLTTAVMGASAYLSPKHIEKFGGQPVLFAIMIFLMLAGMCGGIVAAKIPSATDYEEFLGAAIGFSLPGAEDKPLLIKAAPKVWESWEHLLFWIAILIYPAAILVSWVKAIVTTLAH